MKNIAAIALFVAASFVTAGSVLAQTPSVKATIPFNFSVGNSTLPAGTYTISAENPSSRVILLTSRDQHVRAMTMGQPDQYNPRRVSNLEFHRYGNKYYLAEVRSSAGSMNIHFVTTKAEKSARIQTEQARETVADPILLALN